jgi:hypothetical protein
MTGQHPGLRKYWLSSHNDFISIHKKMIVLISLNRCGLVGVGLGEPRKGENELSMKKEYF